MTNDLEFDDKPVVDPDQVLRAYFDRERPHHWPALALPPARPPRRPLTRSRLALAASLFVLVAGAGAASQWGRPFAAPPAPLPVDVFPPTAQKPGATHRPPPPPSPSTPIPPLPARSR